MRRKLVTVILAAAMSVSLLAGCGNSAGTENNSNTEGETESAEASESTEAECEHEWVDATCQEPKHCSKCGETEGTPLDHEWAEATFAAPKTCTLCGETEGERTQSYFEEHGVEVPDAPVSCTVDGLIHNRDNPEEFQKVVDTTWEQTECYIEPAEEDGYQLIHLELVKTLQVYYDAQQGINYTTIQDQVGVYDWYTGREFPGRDMEGDDSFDYATTLEIDGASYDVSYAHDNGRVEQGDWVYDDAGNGLSDIKVIFSYVFKVPDGYDGLVFAAIPKREYQKLDTETVVGVEEARYAVLDYEGTKFFRINRSDDSAIMTGANAASGAVSGDTSDGAVIDDGREQGSIGESGKPYYKVGFSPKDFTIGGLNLYDGKSQDEMYEAIDLPDQDRFSGGEGAWYKENNVENEEVRVWLHASERNVALAYYSNDVREAKIFLCETDGQTIAEADVVQSPVVPGEMTFFEAADALGLRDIITAMGIQGDAFKDAKIEFESQFSENSECEIIWNDDVHNLVVDWIDRDGNDIHLVLIGTDDMVHAMSISREN